MRRGRRDDVPPGGPSDVPPAGPGDAPPGTTASGATASGTTASGATATGSIPLGTAIPVPGGQEITSPENAEAAIARLYHEHWDRLVRLSALLTRDASTAEEIVQEAFVALHQRWDDLSDRGAAHAYLRTSVVNRSRSALRHRGVEERHRQPGPPEPAGPEEYAVRADEDARVMAALRTLSRRQQEVLVLRYYGDFSEQDIAATLGLSKGAVKSHAHRGLAALRAALERGTGPAAEEVLR